MFSIEIVSNRGSVSIMLATVPRVGEIISIKKGYVQVAGVIHHADAIDVLVWGKQVDADRMMQDFLDGQ